MKNDAKQKHSLGLVINEAGFIKESLRQIQMAISVQKYDKTSIFAWKLFRIAKNYILKNLSKKP